jgi:hypothetical protein
MKTVKNKSSKKHRNPVLVALRKRHATTTTTMKDKRDAMWDELIAEEMLSDLNDNDETEC